jgi:threonine 3-dehydrogenase
MKQKAILITGACGEVGTGLLEKLKKEDSLILAIDKNCADREVENVRFLAGDVTDPDLYKSLEQNYELTSVYHLAALLSSAGEKNPDLAYNVNVDGSRRLFQHILKQIEQTKQNVSVIFPSTIAVYGVTKLGSTVAETDALTPTTLYGITKLFVEQLGSYLCKKHPLFDFRAVRYPGLLSAETVPTGGTSDYGPEMVHAAATYRPYSCFVREDSTLPFMAMPDAVRALIELKDAPADKLTQRVYNINAFSISAKEIAELVKAQFPHAEISYSPNPKRQQIVDSWPDKIIDAPARNDWNWSEEFNKEKTFSEYLFPAVINHYNHQKVANI